MTREEWIEARLTAEWQSAVANGETWLSREQWLDQVKFPVEYPVG
jgi:hypothetical protein